jgi:hypothetical protein
MLLSFCYYPRAIMLKPYSFAWVTKDGEIITYPIYTMANWHQLHIVISTKGHIQLFLKKPPSFNPQKLMLTWS